jgi:hypothetical protein
MSTPVTEGHLDCAKRNSCKQQESGEADLPAMWSLPDLLKSATECQDRNIKTSDRWGRHMAEAVAGRLLRRPGLSSKPVYVGLGPGVA